MNQYPQNNPLGNYNQYNPAVVYPSTNGFPQTSAVQYNFNNYIYPCYSPSVPPCPPTNLSNFETNGTANVPAIPPNQYPYVQTNQAYYGMTADAANYNVYQKPPEKVEETSNRQSSNSYNRLPSPDSFIRECQSGKKSTERLSKEELIKKNLKRKSDSPENAKSISRWRNRESHDHDSPTSTRRDKFYQKPRNSFNKKQRSEEFLKRWR